MMMMMMMTRAASAASALDSNIADFVGRASLFVTCTCVFEWLGPFPWLEKAWLIRVDPVMLHVLQLCQKAAKFVLDQQETRIGKRKPQNCVFEGQYPPLGVVFFHYDHLKNQWFRRISETSTRTMGQSRKYQPIRVIVWVGRWFRACWERRGGVQLWGPWHCWCGATQKP